MSTLPKFKVKSSNTRVHVKAGTLPRPGGTSIRVSSRRPVHPQRNVQFLRYAGIICTFHGSIYILDSKK